LLSEAQGRLRLSVVQVLVQLWLHLPGQVLAGATLRHHQWKPQGQNQRVHQKAR
jgi:hypothetical protein